RPPKARRCTSAPAAPTRRKRSRRSKRWSRAVSTRSARLKRPAEAQMGELRLRGRQASAGFAAGPIALLSPSGTVRRRRCGDADGEAAALRNAIAAALQDLAALAAGVGGDGAGVLGFQIAML